MKSHNQTTGNLAPIFSRPIERLSRRKALRALGQGVVGAFVGAATSRALPVAAQATYLPTIAGRAATPGQDEEDGCASTSVLDLAWFKPHLVNEILPKWLAATTPQGLFLPHFDRQWRPLNRNFGTLISQCRLLYNFAQGFALTHDTRYRAAVASGAEFLLAHFRDREHGGWFWSCNLDGTPRERFKDSYGHAFVIFGLAHAYHCTGERDLQTAMLQTWEIVDARFRDADNGFHGRMTETFAVQETTKSQNPLMHLFEALLAAGSVGCAPQLHDAARAIGNFVFDRLVRPQDRRLPERFDMAWNELPPGSDSSGGRLDLGHAFEWAYLAAYAAELGLPKRFLNYANSFLLYGMALGFDWQQGGIYSPAAPNGVIFNQEKGWWEQCETVRALLHFHLRHRRNDLNGPLQRTLECIKAKLIDPQ